MIAQVSAVVSSIMGHTPSPEQPLMEAGLDSLGSVELRNALCSRFSVQLPPTVTLDYPSIASLSAYLSEFASARGDEAAANPDGAAWESVSLSSLSMQVSLLRLNLLCCAPATCGQHCKLTCTAADL